MAVVPSYFSKEEQARRSRFDRLRQLFVGEHEKAFFSTRKARYEYLVINWLELLSLTWSRLQFANFPEISAPADEKIAADSSSAESMADSGDSVPAPHAADPVGEAVSDLVETLALSSLCRTGSLQASWSGAAIVKLSFAEKERAVIARLVDDAQVTWSFPPDNPTTPDGASYWYTTKGRIGPGGKEDTVWIEERQRLSAVTATEFIPAPGKPRLAVRDRLPEQELQFTYHAYNKEGREILDWSLIFADPEDIPTPFTLPIGIPTLVYIPNKQTNGDWRGESDYTLSLQSIQAAINNRYSLNQHILDAHSKPTLLIPEALIVDGMVPVTNIEWVADNGQPGAKTGYVEWSGELGASFQQCDNLWSQFNACAGLTTAISQPSQAETGRAKELEMVGPVAEVRARRPFWEDALQRIIYIAMKLEQHFGLSDLEPVRYARVVWPVVLPDSRTETASVTQQLRGAKALSVETAIRLNFPTWTDGEVAAEVKRIKEEAQVEAMQQAAVKAGGQAQVA